MISVNIYVVLSVFLFFLLVLIVGLIAGKKVEDLRSYAVAGFHYPVFILIFTTLASEVGGALTVGATGEVYKDGIGVSLILFGMAAGFFILGKFVMLNFDDRFKGMISQGDIISKFYGKRAELFFIIIACITAILGIGGQFIALGYILEAMIGINYNIIIIFAAGIVGIYSTFGGIRSVVATDALQFIVIIFVIPMIAYEACVSAGGIDTVLSETMRYNPIAMKASVYTMLYYILPFYFLYSVPIQRFLMAKDSSEIKGVVNKTVIIFMFFICTIVIIGLSARKIISGVENTDRVLSILIVKLFSESPISLAVSIIALISVILSTIDSALNATSILVAGRVERSKMKSNSLSVARRTTICLTVFSSILALSQISVFTIILGLLNISCIIKIATFFVIIRLDVSPKEFWYSVFAVLIVGIIGLQFLTVRELPVLCTAAAVIAFISTHVIKNSGRIVRV